LLTTLRLVAHYQLDKTQNCDTPLNRGGLIHLQPPEQTCWQALQRPSALESQDGKWFPSQYPIAISHLSMS
jgi:hypothetical protein